MAATTTRTFRCSDDPWDKAMDRAQRDGRTLTDVLTRFLRRYADGDPEAVALVAAQEPAASSQ